MRVLRFIVTGQTLKRDTLCDFTGIAAGSRGYLFARFSFDNDWSGCKKVAVFTNKGKEYPVGITGNLCQIPAEALTGPVVQVYVLGRGPGGLQITSSVAAFPQTVRR